MRKVKKYLKNLKTFYSNRHKIKKAKKELREHLGDVEFKFASFGGADMNYYIYLDKKRFAMMRLAIVDIEKDNERPLLRFNKEKRLKKEYDAYTLGSTKNLTPKVLYHSSQMLVCEYLDGQRVFDILKKDKSSVWDILIEATSLYSNLHKLGVVHLDATLKNFIVHDKKMKVIDFEYYPAQRVSLATQKAYDYVRVIEHSLRIVPKEYQLGFEQLIEHLDDIVPKELREADFTELRTLMGNIENYPIYKMLKTQIFKNI